MTIDEALIKSEFGMTYTDEEHDQIIKWLKELKHYQLGDCMNKCEHYENCANYIYSKGYNKAIDDFAEKLCNEDGIELDFLALDYLIEFVYEVSKQLKSRTEL